jgi:protease I
MEKTLTNKSVAILATDGFEESELFEPRRALLEAGAVVLVVSLKRGSIKAWKHDRWGETIPVDLTVDEARASDFDALVLPGGVMNPDHLRMNEKAVEFVRAIGEAGKPIAAICHGPWTLINADLVQGRTLTSWPSLQADLTNAGASWVDREVVADMGLVTSRKPADLPAFNRKMVEEFGRKDLGGTRVA